MQTMLPAAANFPTECAILGRLVVGYGAIELDLCNCAAMGIDDFDWAFKAMFRMRGESARVDMADILARRAYTKMGLKDEFVAALDDMRFCLKLRNRYAHSQIYNDGSGKLAIVALEEEVKKSTVVRNLKNLRTRYLTEPVLKEQESYFLYVRTCIEFVNYEGRFLRGILCHHHFCKPPTLPRPREFG